MTDQRTLKTIIGEQRGTIEKQKLVIDELNENYLKLNAKFDASEAKVEAANKIVDSFPAYVFADPVKGTVTKIPEIRDWLLALHNCLSQEPIKNGFAGLAESMKKEPTR